MEENSFLPLQQTEHEKQFPGLCLSESAGSFQEEGVLELVKNGFTSQCFGVLHTTRHLFLRAIQSPILLAYFILGTIISFVLHGFLGLCFALLNLVILAASAILIRQMTVNIETMPLPVKRTKIELFTGLAAFLLQMLLICLAWHLTNIPVLQPGMNRLIYILYKAANFLCGNGPLHWASNNIGNAFVTTMIELIPALLLFSICEYIPYGIGSRPYGKLTVVLLAVTVLSGLSKMRSTPLRYEFLLQTLVLFVIEIFVSGLPEELFFRGFLLPRLERAFKDPVTCSGTIGSALQRVSYPVSSGPGRELVLCPAECQSIVSFWVAFGLFVSAHPKHYSRGSAAHLEQCAWILFFKPVNTFCGKIGERNFRVK